MALHNTPRSRAMTLGLVLSMLTACGGGGNDNDDEQNEQQFEEQTIAMDVLATASGYISQNGFVATENDAFVGTIPDISGFLEERGFLTFVMTALPEGATLVSAQLRALQLSAAGTPYDQVVRIIVDHVNIGGVLDSPDFNGPALSVITTPPLSEDPVEEIKTLDVTAQIQADLDAGRTQSSFRLRGQAINPLTAGNQDLVDPVDLARFSSTVGESIVQLVIRVPVAPTE